MDFYEADLEDIIMSANTKDLRERGLFISGKRLQQLRIGNYGVADIVTYKRNTVDDIVHIDIWELKKGKLDFSAFGQSLRYWKGIVEYLNGRGVSFDYHISINLVGRTIAGGNGFYYISDFIDDNSYISKLRLYKYSYGLDGLSFEMINDYRLTNPGF